MTRRYMPILPALLACIFANAQSGSIQISFIPQGGAGKPVIIQVAIAPLKYNNPHGYWFLNPHNGDRHLQYGPEMYWADKVSTAGYLTFNERKDDFDVYENTGHDSNAVSVQNKEYVISAPKYQFGEDDKNKPLHVHINTFNASECSFTISGRGTLQSVNGFNTVQGTVEGSGHLYRESRYDKSDVMPGCDCDPTIYATVYDEENNVRTTSACENALKNKVFDAVQKSLMPLYENINFKGTGGMEAGNISISTMAGHVDINVPDTRHAMVQQRLPQQLADYACRAKNIVQQ